MQALRHATIRRALLCAFAAVVATGGWSAAQQMPVDLPQPTFVSRTDVVRLEVSVLDKDRHPVRGLGVDDFTVLENGKARPVVAFTPVELPAAVMPVGEPVAAWVRDAPKDVVDNADADVGRLVVIAFDWSIRMDDQPGARRIALSAVDALGPADEAAVLFSKPNGAAGRPQGFTADHARLRAAINQPFAAALTCPPGGKCDANSSIIVDPEGYESGECLCGLCTLEALTQLGRTLSAVSQRPKVVLFIGTYVRTFEMMQPTPVPPLKPGEIAPTFSTMPGTTGCAVRLRDARRAFERAMGDANVTVHVLDPVGLESPSNSPLGIKRMRERLDSLPVMADITGGRTVMNTNAPEATVPAILDESRSYYLLGFTPAPMAKDAEVRAIEVHVRPKGLTVKARNQYTSDAAAGHGVPAKPGLNDALATVLPRGDVPMEVSAVPLVAGSRAAAVVVGRVAAGTARPTAVLTAAFTPRAVPVASRRLTIPPAGREADPRALGLVSALALAPGFYELRVAVELPGGVSGSVHTFVDIPDFPREPLSMSGVLLHVTPEEPAAPRDEIDGVLPFVPTARRAFTQTEGVSAFVQISQGTSRKDLLHSVTVRVRIIDTRDHTVRDQSSSLDVNRFSAHRTANAQLPLPMRDLPPGQYLLRFDAEMNTRHAERLMRFEVR